MRVLKPRFTTRALAVYRAQKEAADEKDRAELAPVLKARREEFAAALKERLELELDTSGCEFLYPGYYPESQAIGTVEVEGLRIGWADKEYGAESQFALVGRCACGAYSVGHRFHDCYGLGYHLDAEEQKAAAGDPQVYTCDDCLTRRWTAKFEAEQETPAGLLAAALAQFVTGIVGSTLQHELRAAIAEIRQKEQDQ